jgi:hypothetical protein
MKTEMWTWMRVQFFRFWTALVVLGAYGYFWLNTPEYLTWWKRTVNTLIEKGCDMLSYPWGDRIESTVGNFGIWVQITLAILIFRTIIGTVLILIRASSAAADTRSSRLNSASAPFCRHRSAHRRTPD